MFIELYKMLNSEKFYNTSIEIEILKGWFEKSITIKEKIERMKRKYNFK